MVLLRAVVEVVVKDVDIEEDLVGVCPTLPMLKAVADGTTALKKRRRAAREKFIFASCCVCSRWLVVGVIDEGGDEWMEIDEEEE